VLRPSSAGQAIQIFDRYTRIEGLEITGWSAGEANSYDGINIRGQDILVDGVIVHDDEGPEDNADCNGIALEEPHASAVVRNSMVYNISRAGIIIMWAEYASLVVQSSTVWSCVLADDNPQLYGCVSIRGGVGSEILAENVIAMGSMGVGDFSAEGPTPDEVGAFRISSRSNLSSDDTAPGSGSQVDKLPDAQFVSLPPGPIDLHLRDDAAAINGGVNLSADFVGDIDGQTRPATGAWDIGADER
jgi:hypothetical protein